MKNILKKTASTLMAGVGFANMCLSITSYAMLSSEGQKKSEEDSSQVVVDTQNEKDNKYKELRTLLKLGKIRDFEEKLGETSIEELKNKNGESLLHEAARYDQVKVFDLLLRNGLDVNIKDNEGNTPMHVAAQNDSEKIAELIISLDPKSVYAVNNNNENPVLLAVKSNAKKVSAILMGTGLDFNNYFVGKFNLIQIAAKENAFGVLSECVKVGKADLSKQDEHGNTLLHIAAENDSMEVVKFLIKNGANVNAKNDIGATSLHKAAQANSKRVCELLIDKKLGKNKADVDEKDLEGRTPLHYAAMSDSSAAAKYLISRKANSMIKDVNGCIPVFLAAINKADKAYAMFKEGISNERDINGQTAMHHAVLTRDISLASFLLDRGFDIRSKNTENLNSLQLANNERMKEREDNFEKTAVLKFTNEFVRLLESKGIDCSEINIFDERILHNAVAENLLEETEYLISEGADINSKNEIENTPLHVAVAFGFNKISKLLVSKGADVNAKNKDHQTPLHIAAFNNSKSTVRLLTSQKNIDVNVKDKTGFTPLSIAVIKGFREIVELLVLKGANINFDDNHGIPLLFLTAFNDSTDILEYLLYNGADPNRRGARSIEKSDEYPSYLDKVLGYHKFSGQKFDIFEKPLITFLIQGDADNFHACMQKQDKSLETEFVNAHCSEAKMFNFIKVLLDHGADPNALCTSGTPLNYSIEHNLFTISELLISRGANVNGNTENSRNPFLSPLHIAVGNNDDRMVKLLIDKGANVNAAVLGLTVLRDAVSHNSIDCVKLLILNGAELDTRDEKGYTALHVAVGEGLEECVNLLVDAGADVNIKASEGITPISLAMMLQIGHNNITSESRVRIVKKLLSVYINSNKSENSSLLYMAICSELPTDVITCLIRKGVKLNCKNLYGGKTALSLVLNYFPGRQDVCDIIKTAGGVI